MFDAKGVRRRLRIRLDRKSANVVSMVLAP
jgi:hypothetical protein